MTAIPAPAIGSYLTSSPSPPSQWTITPDERLLLVSLIETQQFGPTVKAIFDRQWYQSTEYQWILNESVTNKQIQIKQICEEHYAEFLAGIEHLLSVKLDLSELRSLAHSLNHSVQQSGRAVLASARQLNEQRRLRYQINTAKQILQSCASLIALARKAKTQIYHTKYFSALKTLNQLQRILHVAANNFHKTHPNTNVASPSSPKSPSASSTLSPSSKSYSSLASSIGSSSVTASAASSSSASNQSSAAVAAASNLRFEFLHQLERQIPLLTTQIKESVRAEFSTWLNGITKRSTQIGELALAQLDEHLTATKKSDTTGSSHHSKKSKKRSHKKHHHHHDEDSASNASDDETNRSNGIAHGQSTTSQANLFDTIPINFTPIYQCLHIYEHLNLAEQFQNMYKDKRRAQLMEILNTLSVLGTTPGATSSSFNSPPSTNHANPLASPKIAKSASPPLASSPTMSHQQQQQQPQSDYIEVYSAVFAGVTGFFIIEDNILRSGNELISRAEIETLYEKVQLLLITYLSKHFVECAAKSSPSYVLQLKYLLILFSKLMSEHYLSHDSSLLRSFLESHRTVFETILLRRLHTDLEKILSKERWEPLAIKTYDEYQLFVRSFDLQEDGLAIEFPCTMPFSISVPLFCRVLANFIEDYFAYAKWLDDDGGGGDTVDSSPSASSSSIGGGVGVGVGSKLSSTWRSYILHALNRALCEEVNGTFMEYLSTGDIEEKLPISQTVQFSINAQVLSELGCTYLEKLVRRYSHDESDLATSTSSVTNEERRASPTTNGGSVMSSPSSSPSAVQRSPLHQARQLLMSTKLRCEDLIFELIASKIDQFLDLAAEFNWTPDAVQSGPSDYILDLIAYLETTFYLMGLMPDAVREAVHFFSCKHIANRLMELLTTTPGDGGGHGACKKFNIIGIANLNQDLHVIEAFAQRCPIQNLIETFSEIRQLLDLLLSGDIEVLLDAGQRASRYPHLSTQKLFKVLDKFKDISMFSLSTPAQFKKLKKKNIDAVVNQLKKGMPR